MIDNKIKVVKISANKAMVFAHNIINMMHMVQ